jgi:hypothetical protein
MCLSVMLWRRFACACAFVIQSVCKLGSSERWKAACLTTSCSRLGWPHASFVTGLGGDWSSDKRQAFQVYCRLTEPSNISYLFENTLEILLL